MKLYYLIVKSHTDAPDTETQLYAKDLEEALDMAEKLTNLEREYLEKYCVTEVEYDK